MRASFWFGVYPLATISLTYSSPFKWQWLIQSLCVINIVVGLFVVKFELFGDLYEQSK